MKNLLKYGSYRMIMDEQGREISSVHKDEMLGGYFITLFLEGVEYRFDKNPLSGTLFKSENQARQLLHLLGCDLARGVFNPKSWY